MRAQVTVRNSAAIWYMPCLLAAGPGFKETFCTNTGVSGAGPSTGIKQLDYVACTSCMIINRTRSPLTLEAALLEPKIQTTPCPANVKLPSYLTASYRSHSGCGTICWVATESSATLVPGVSASAAWPAVCNFQFCTVRSRATLEIPYSDRRVVGQRRIRRSIASP